MTRTAFDRRRGNVVDSGFADFVLDERKTWPGRQGRP